MAELAGNPFWYWKEHDMEMGMQMTCIGFPKAASLERETALQLPRLRNIWRVPYHMSAGD